MIDAIPFTAEDYVFWSRIQGTAWTGADLIICYYTIRLANLLRRQATLRPHRLAPWVLAATVPFAALLPVAPDGTAFFRLELLVTIPHFLILLSVFAANMKHATVYITLLLSHQNHSSDSG